MKKIYIILTFTGTILSRSIKIFTGNSFTHASISLDEKMERMYSFGRLNPYNPFIGGFVREGIHIGTFKRFKNTITEIYSLEITNEQYERLEEVINNFLENKQVYKFNLIGLIIAGMNKSYKRKNRYYCSQFVREVIEQSKIEELDMSNVIKPEDFKKLAPLKLEYKGLLRMYN